MDFLRAVLEMLLVWARSIWPGVLGASAGGCLGWSILGFPGFLVGAAVGALGGTWTGNRFGLVSVRKMTGSATNDQMLYAGGAFALVVAGYFLVQFAMLIGAIVAIAALAMFWMQG